MASKKQIPNPNTLSILENDFLDDNKSKPEKTKDTKSRHKGRMISMSDEFYKELNNFIKENPTEGNRSSFVVRIVANYIKSKN
jgi:hypothetical protein